MGVTVEDGITYYECDKKECQLEIRSNPQYKSGKIYHPSCVPD